MKPAVTEREAFAYGSILEALSFGLYPDKRHVLREFIQNAFDALADLRIAQPNEPQKPIEVRLIPPSIFIGDWGIGMDADEVKKYRCLGYSGKDRAKSVGFRGIGKDSGLAAAEKIIVNTSKLGSREKFTVVIDAKGMLDELNVSKNPPLDRLLERHTEVSSAAEAPGAHYTFVELHRIRADAAILFDVQKVAHYIKHNCPVPFGPDFPHAAEVDEQLRLNVPDYVSTPLLLNDSPLYKAFPPNHTRPDYERIFQSDETGAPLVAFCWYCGNTGKGQFEDKDNSGLVYRVKNFAVGDRNLTRETLWSTTPERAFYFLGEVHVLDSEILPSTDRTDFEDTPARERLYDRARRIAQVLSQRAGLESEQRRLEVKFQETDQVIAERKQRLARGQISGLLKADVQFEVRRAVEDLEERLKRAKGRRRQTDRDKTLTASAGLIVKKGQALLKELQGDRHFYDIYGKLSMTGQAKVVYQVVTDCLKEELKDKPLLLERLIARIDRVLMARLVG